MNVLRPYQQDTVESVFESWKEYRSVLVVLPTGTGKTQVFCEIIKRVQPKRSLVLVHRSELVWQAVRRLESFGIDAEVEMAEYRAGVSFWNRAPVIVSTVQTQAAGNQGEGRMSRFNPADFAAVICDEAHHFCSPQFQKVLSYYRQNPDLKIFGCTATPDRADEQALGKVFDTVSYDYEILDAINDGWLVPIEQQMVTIEGLDFSAIRTTAGDLNGGDLAAILETEKNLHGIASATLDIISDKKTIVFTASVKQAEMLSEIFNRNRLGMSDWVCGETPKEDRRKSLEKFSNGSTQIMVNCNVLGEGFDEPSIEYVIQARPTKSRCLYCLDVETEILTKDGWKNHIKKGEMVAAFDNSTEEIKWMPVLDTVRRKLLEGESWISIRGPSCDLKVTGNHRMIYDNSRGLGWKIRDANYISELRRGCYLPTAGYEKKDGVPLTDDELRFIGWVMTDGTINPLNGQVSITQGEHQPWIEDIHKMLVGCGFKFTRSSYHRKTPFVESSKCVRWTISKGAPRGRDKHLSGWGRLDKFLSKDLSVGLMEMTQRQFEIFLEAIHLGDGSKQSGQSWIRRSYHITTKRKIVTERIQIMAITNGWRCSVSNYLNYGKTLYVIHLKKQNWISVGSCYDGRPTFKKENGVDGEICWCVNNALGTIVTRRNGKVTIMGNSQQVGRATRPLPGIIDRFGSAEERKEAIAASDKRRCVVVDFVGNSGRHKLITTADILGGNSSDEAIERANVRAKKTKGSVNMVDILEEEEERLRLEAEERKRLEAARKARLIGKAKYSAISINPFNAFDLLPHRSRGWDDGRQLSEKQTSMLLKQGIDPSQMSFPEAKQVINEMFRRWNGNLCSLKQCSLLKKHGYETKNLAREEASKLIDALAKNGWRRPVEVTI